MSDLGVLHLVVSAARCVGFEKFDLVLDGGVEDLSLCDLRFELGGRGVVGSGEGTLVCGGDLGDVGGEGADVGFDGLEIILLVWVYAAIEDVYLYLYATEEIAIAQNRGTRLNVLHCQTGHDRVTGNSGTGSLVCALLRTTISCASAVWVGCAIAAGLLLLLALVGIAGVARVLVRVRRHDGGLTDQRRGRGAERKKRCCRARGGEVGVAGNGVVLCSKVRLNGRIASGH